MGEKFLISRLSALGDTVCCLPAAVALKKTFPECQITWAVDPRFAGVVGCCGAVDRIVKLKPSYLTVLGPLAPDLTPLRERYDAAFDLQGLLKSAICIARAKSKVKLGYHWQREGAGLFSQRVMPDPSSLHVVDQYVDVVRAAGAQAGRAEFELRPGSEDVLAVRSKLKAKGLSGRFVAVNAGAGWATKRWPAASFCQVIERLGQENMPCVLIGGKADADREAASQVLQGCRTPPIDMLGETSIRELIALLRLASAHLGGDTGSTHIAAALEIPAIGLYSVTNPQRSCPYGQIDRCHYNPESFASIDPEAVTATILEAIHS